VSTVLITGCSTGIGLHTALTFGRAGHKVTATMRGTAQASALAKVADGEHLAIAAHKMDVDDERSVRDAIGRIEQEMGPIDVLVNNAGIERMGSVEELPLAEFRCVMETNYFGAIRRIQAVLPAMRATVGEIADLSQEWKLDFRLLPAALPPR
jgi:NAD(P)-dependent dehydrogenase (short-subunit alcohol dehydrogenase family)